MKPDFTLQEQTLLEQFYVFPYLTAKQAIELRVYKVGGASRVRKKLQEFTESGHLLTKCTSLHGKAPYAYWLGAKGRHYLQGIGYDFSDWKRQPSEMYEFVTSSHFPHNLGINDFLIAALQLPTVEPRIQIEKVIHDLTLKRLMSGAPVIPDGLVKFASGDKPVIWLEWDMDKEKEVSFKTKLRGILELMQYSWDTWFATPLEHFTWAFVTPFGEVRVREMIKWTQSQLTALHQEELGSMFLFAALPHNYDPSVFTAPVWASPFSTSKSSKYSLLEV